LQHEDLVILPPQLAEPLHGQRFGGDDQRALGAPRADEVVGDQTGLDRLAEAHLVGEQPAHRVLPRRLEGDVQLVREQADATSEERADVVGRTRRRQVHRVEPDREGVERADVAEGEPLDRGIVGRGELALVPRHEGVRRGAEPEHRLGLDELDDDVAALERGDAADAEVGVETVRHAVVDLPHGVRYPVEPWRKRRW
jgi:hypothetical protein